jgi:hypothetical protein
MDAVARLFATATPLHQSSIAQHAQMMRNAGLLKEHDAVKVLLDFAGVRTIALTKETQNAQAYRVGQGFEHVDLMLIREICAAHCAPSFCALRTACSMSRFAARPRFA